MENDEASFDYDWLTKEDYQFKILALLAVLADSNLAYRGTLADMCEFFGTSSSNSKTDQKIWAAIEALEAEGLLKKVVDGRVITLTLSRKAERQRRVIRIQKEWVKIAKEYPTVKNKSVSVSWEKLLRVWLFFLDDENARRPFVTNREISAEIGMTVGTVKNARSALTKDIRAIMSTRLFEHCGDDLFKCIGSKDEPLAWVENPRQSS